MHIRQRRDATLELERSRSKGEREVGEDGWGKREEMHRRTGTPIRRRDQNGSRWQEERAGADRRGRPGRGQPPVLILIENAFVEKEARV